MVNIFKQSPKENWKYNNFNTLVDDTLNRETLNGDSTAIIIAKFF
jgi:hypothetical protein